jgi:N-glycosylase/DNA lyase
LLRRIDLGGEPLNLDFTFESGQIFQWRKADGWWLGIVGTHATMLRTEGGSLLVRSNPEASEERIKEFMCLNVRYDDLAGGRSVDEFTSSLLQDYRGLRILKQDPWSCLMSYIVSASLSIRAIDRVLGSIASSCRELNVDGLSLRELPGPSDFLNVRRPRKRYLGRKWSYLRQAARDIDDGTLDFDEIRSLPYDVAWSSLVIAKESHVMGVGPKVADCLLLFSLDKPEAFPMDRWIMRGLQRHYGWLVPERIATKLRNEGEALTVREYEAVSQNVRSHFGKLGGLVQECLFLHMRTARPGRPSA